MGFIRKDAVLPLGEAASVEYMLYLYYCPCQTDMDTCRIPVSIEYVSIMVDPFGNPNPKVRDCFDAGLYRCFVLE